MPAGSSDQHNANGTGVQANAAQATTSSASDIIRKLEWYYTHLFPMALFKNWLRYGSDDILSRREVSFTLPGDIYLRFKSFSSGEEFHTALKKLQPIKIDIGAVYNFPPSERNSRPATLIPVSKELVFDIDMTDYEDVLGELGKGSAMEACDRCWPIMAAGVRIIDTALRQDFGFKHILWVYSGRRGVHCWVADSRARKLTNEQRSAATDFLHVRFAGEGRKGPDLSVPLHPSLARARRICDPAFQDFCIDQVGILNDESLLKTLAASIPPRSVHDVAERVRRAGEAGIARWERLERELRQLSRQDFALRGAADSIVLRHTYARLDANVSKEVNHLLKAPFCVHPKTGRVCVPFDPEKVDSFRPGANAPHVGTLLQEMNAGDGPATKALQVGVHIFEEFVSELAKEVREEDRAARMDGVDKLAVKELLAGV